MTREFERINTVVGKGKISQRATIGEAGGAWTACVDSVNSLIGDLVQPTAEVARVIGSGGPRRPGLPPWRWISKAAQGRVPAPPRW